MHFDRIWNCVTANDMLVVFPPRDTHTALPLLSSSSRRVQKASKTKSHRIPSRAILLAYIPLRKGRAGCSPPISVYNGSAAPIPHFPRFSRVNACKDGTGGEFHIPSMDRGGTGEFSLSIFALLTGAPSRTSSGRVGNYRCYACIRERELVEKFENILGA